MRYILRGKETNTLRASVEEMNLKCLLVPPALPEHANNVLELDEANAIPLLDPAVELRREADAGMAERPYHGLEGRAKGFLHAISPARPKKEGFWGPETGLEDSSQATSKGEESGVHRGKGSFGFW